MRPAGIAILFWDLLEGQKWKKCDINEFFDFLVKRVNPY